VRASWFSGFELGSVVVGVTVVYRIYAYELVQRFCEIKRGNCVYFFV